MNATRQTTILIIGALGFIGGAVARRLVLYGQYRREVRRYYEDVDLCVCLWRAERRVMRCPAVWVLHDAQHAIQHDLRHMRWHTASIAHYGMGDRLKSRRVRRGTA